MDFWRWLSGIVTVRLTSANVAERLSQIGQADIDIFQAELLDELTASFFIHRTDLKKLEGFLSHRGDRIEVINRSGLYWFIKRVLMRPILTFGVLILLIANGYLQGRVLFVQVVGNEDIPARLILEEAEKTGLGFGSLRREIRSEKIKNSLLERIPQLKWAGVNTTGCVATILVRERQLIPDQEPPKTVSSIVAARDGVVLGFIVTNGNLVCRTGQAVKAGEVLISGYTDCGLMIRATHAEGEVYAKTERTISAVYPTCWKQNASIKNCSIKYAMKIGKKRINFDNGSGISYPCCGKIYEENYLTLPGGFQLPIALIKETVVYYDQAEVQQPQNDVTSKFSDFAAGYLSEQMIAGQILSASEVVTESYGLCQLEGKYACQEMIGQVRKEEIYGNND